MEGADREDLERRYRHLQSDLEQARKKVRPSTSFDADYWTSAAETCEVSVRVLEAETKLAIRKWTEDDDGGPDARSWWATKEARRIVAQIKATTYEGQLYNNQADQIKRGGPIRRAFQAMFTTSQMGICADKVGMAEQSKFKKHLIHTYNAATTRLNKPKVIVSLHDSATGLDLS